MAKKKSSRERKYLGKSLPQIDKKTYSYEEILLVTGAIAQQYRDKKISKELAIKRLQFNKLLAKKFLKGVAEKKALKVINKVLQFIKRKRR